MKTLSNFKFCRLTGKIFRNIHILLLSAFFFHVLEVNAVNLTPLPPYLAETKGAPMVMLNISKDHQLFYKAYNEYSDLDGDNQIETQYKHSYRYYGYFDNHRCYKYDTAKNRYYPFRLENGATTAYPGYCRGDDEWHGNFLNWATMTRMDVVRRILYGGYRSTDNTTTSPTDPSVTVLERAHLPSDAHSFAKYYSSTEDDIRNLTPFSAVSEITICNTSPGNGDFGRYSHSSNIGPPLIKVAKGNFSLWNSNEKWQCYWSEEKTASNGNVPAISDINAASSNPSRASKALGTGYAAGTYIVRVEVCKTGLDSPAEGTTGFTDDEEGRCKFYPLGNYKPAGLLQKYGERKEAAFGLMTGSFSKNTSGGVLRKNVAAFTDEIDLDDGQFKTATLPASIVQTLNKLRIYGYDYDDGTYIGADNCSYQRTSLTDGECTSWGNPMGEMYLESLRYLAGKTQSTTFSYTTANSKDDALGLSIAAWSDPFDANTVASFGDQLCRRTSIVNFNASVTSYDNDQWTGQSALNLYPAKSVEDLTNDIGTAEHLYATNKKWTIGSTTNDTNEYCNDKTISSLATSIGICPEAPTYKGGFKIAGAALSAHTTPIRTDFDIPSNNKQAFRIDTYGVALATGTPRIKVPMPGQAEKYVLILPAYRLKINGTEGAGTLVDFRVVSQTATSGKYVVQWEDSEQGGDYDQDVWGTLEYSVDPLTKKISVSTDVIAEETNQPQGFGYVISGTGDNKDGVHFHSGIEGFTYIDNTNITVTPTTHLNSSGGCNSCQPGDAKTTAVYTMVGVSDEVLKDPLYYAAKYGGFDRSIVPAYVPGTDLPVAGWDAKTTNGSAGSDGVPDTFFYAIDPAQLERSLEQVFSTILKAGGAAPAAATSSRTAAGGYVYVSTESINAASTGNDADNSGEFLRFSFLDDGTVAGTANWDAGAKLTTQVLSGGWDTNRRIFTMNNEATGNVKVPFRWTYLSTNQKTALRKNPADETVTDTNTVGQRRLNWIRGDSEYETTSGKLRKRTKTKLGAIINSTPWFIGAPSAGYTNSDYGTGYGAFRIANADRNSVAVGANDGMLHIFDAETGFEQFAYVPRVMYQTSSTAPYSKLSALTAKDFLITDGINRLTVDGSVMAADMNLSSSTTPNWRTYLFGSFGRGAKGVYALDVTSPQTITAENTSNAAAVVKWEFTSAVDADFGHVIGRTNPKNNGQPWQTGYMANNKWAVIYGNGYNSSTGNAALFIIFADGPTSNDPVTGWSSGTYVKIPTGPLGQGPDNGLATPTAVDTNNDGKIDVIYAGDLKGNVWKFDVSSDVTSNWAVATQASSTDTTKVPLFTATTTLPSPSTTIVNQPITTAVIPFVHPQGGYQIFFGTGKALELTDYPMSTVYSQSLYGIYDKPGSVGPITTGKTDLVQQTSYASGKVRYFSKNAVSYINKKGWYLDLPASSESVIFNPFAEDSYRVNVRSLAPEATTNGCRYDATSFEAIINPINGLPISNLIPSADIVTGYGAVGMSSLNSFEFSRGGVYRKPTPPPSDSSSSNGASCEAGSPNCVCNPDDSTECVKCLDPATCNPPWKPLPQNQCMYRTISALGSGGIATSERFGACSAGRLTWREIMRNR